MTAAPIPVRDEAHWHELRARHIGGSEFERRLALRDLQTAETEIRNVAHQVGQLHLQRQRPRVMQPQPHLLKPPQHPIP